MQARSVNEETAREHLQKGAKVIDVRTAEEFRERHLPKAINIPLGELKERIGREVPDKETVLLLHCQVGGRSAIGAQMLKTMGYKQVFNLGSLEKAERAVGEQAK